MITKMRTYNQLCGILVLVLIQPKDRQPKISHETPRLAAKELSQCRKVNHANDVETLARLPVSLQEAALKKSYTNSASIAALDSTRRLDYAAQRQRKTAYCRDMTALFCHTLRWTSA